MLFVPNSGTGVRFLLSRSTPPSTGQTSPDRLAHLSTNMERKVAVGNAMSRWVAAVVRRAHLAKMIWWVENPLGSYLWLQPEWTALIAEFNLQSTRTDYCRWGTPYRKDKSS